MGMTGQARGGDVYLMDGSKRGIRFRSEILSIHPHAKQTSDQFQRGFSESNAVREKMDANADDKS